MPYVHPFEKTMAKIKAWLDKQAYGWERVKVPSLEDNGVPEMEPYLDETDKYILNIWWSPKAQQEVREYAIKAAELQSGCMQAMGH